MRRIRKASLLVLSSVATCGRHVVYSHPPHGVVEQKVLKARARQPHASEARSCMQRVFNSRAEEGPGLLEQALSCNSNQRLSLGGVMRVAQGTATKQTSHLELQATMGHVLGVPQERSHLCWFPSSVSPDVDGALSLCGAAV